MRKLWHLIFGAAKNVEEGMNNNIIIIGYSGHGFVVCDISERNNLNIVGYCDNEEKIFNPYQLTYLGTENDLEVVEQLKYTNYSIAIGNNRIREKIQTNLTKKGLPLAVNLIHPSAQLSRKIKLSKGVLIAPNVVINAFAEIGEGAICNTSAVIEHEVKLGKYSFVGPNATLLGAVEEGDFSFIGANATIKQGIKIGRNVTIGAGSVVIRDVMDNQTVVGNPQRIIK